MLELARLHPTFKSLLQSKLLRAVGILSKLKSTFVSFNTLKRLFIHICSGDMLSFL